LGIRGMHISGQSGLCSRRTLAYLPVQETITPSPAAERKPPHIWPGMLTGFLKRKCRLVVYVEHPSFRKVFAHMGCVQTEPIPGERKKHLKHEKEDLLTRKGKILDGCQYVPEWDYLIESYGFSLSCLFI
jgi:hypothetical protein